MPKLDVIHGPMAAKRIELPRANKTQLVVQTHRGEFNGFSRILCRLVSQAFSSSRHIIQKSAHLCNAKSRCTACYHAKVMTLADVVYYDIARQLGMRLLIGHFCVYRGLSHILFWHATVTSTNTVTANSLTIAVRLHASACCVPQLYSPGFLSKFSAKGAAN